MYSKTSCTTPKIPSNAHFSIVHSARVFSIEYNGFFLVKALWSLVQAVSFPLIFDRGARGVAVYIYVVSLKTDENT